MRTSPRRLWPRLAPVVLLALIATTAPTLTGCGGGFALRAPRVAYAPGSMLSSARIASAVVIINGDMNADKIAMLQRFDVPGHMSNALIGVGNGPAPLNLQITITRFRNGFGPARMHTQTVVMDGSGQTIRAFETESLSMRGGSKVSRLRRIAQHNVDNIAAAL